MIESLRHAVRALRRDPIYGAWGKVGQTIVFLSSVNQPLFS
jgi:hypothetical protein